jgi:hypothetical protein
VDFLRKRLPAQVGRYLEGVEFPARKEELLGRLERNGVPGPVLGQLRKRLPEGEYRGPRTSCPPCAGGVSWPKTYGSAAPNVRGARYLSFASSRASRVILRSAPTPARPTR